MGRIFSGAALLANAILASDVIKPPGLSHAQHAAPLAADHRRAASFREYSRLSTNTDFNLLTAVKIPTPGRNMLENGKSFYHGIHETHARMFF
jgi:hypothetical protein